MDIKFLIVTPSIVSEVLISRTKMKGINSSALISVDENDEEERLIKVSFNKQSENIRYRNFVSFSTHLNPVKNS